MASVGASAVKIIDNDSDVVTVTSNRLDVNATLVAGATIDIGDVDMFLDGGTAILGGAGDVASGVLRVTIAADDNVSTKLTAIDADLGYIRSSVATTATQTTNLASFIQTEDLAHSSGDVGYMFLGVRNDTLASLVDTDGDYAPLQVNASGALYVTGESKQNTSVADYGFSIMGEAKVIDGSALPNSVSEGNASRIAISRTGIQYTHLTNDTGTVSAILEEDSSHSSGDYGIMSLAVRNDALESLAGSDGDYTPLQVNSSGALFVGHDITGGADGVTTVSSAGNDVELASSTACKKVDIQAQTDNTGLIAVGFTGVDATEASGTGVILYAGDTYSLEIGNLNLIYIDSTVSGEGVRYTYFT